MQFDKLIRYLIIRATGFESVVNYNNNMIYFDFKDRHIVVLFSSINEAFEPNELIETLEDLDVDTFCSNHIMQGLYLSDALFVTEEDNIRENPMPHFIEMSQYLKQINRHFSDAVVSYNVDYSEYDNCGWTMGCPIVYEYGYKIEIAPKYWYDHTFIAFVIDNLFTNQINSTVWNIYKLSLPKIPVSDNNKVKIIISNTKTRRLGYLKYIISLFDQPRYISQQALLKKVENDVDALQAELESYKNTKGLVQKKGLSSSISPYIDVACSLGLIQMVNNGYEVTKLGKVYNTLTAEQIISNTERNRFVLNIIDKTIFLEAILNNDYLYIYTILEYAYILKRPSYKNLKQIFKDLVISNIDKIIQTETALIKTSRIRLIEIKKRIQTWAKAEIYMEHVLMPRLNWLYDLDLLVLENDFSFELTPQGEKIFNILTTFHDSNCGIITSPEKFFEVKFMHLIEDVYAEGSIIDEEKIQEKLPQYIDQCFAKFKTLAPNRITYSILVAYVKRLILITEHLIVEESTIKEYLINNPNKYIFKYQKHYQDGYVQLKK